MNFDDKLDTRCHEEQGIKRTTGKSIRGNSETSEDDNERY